MDGVSTVMIYHRTARRRELGAVCRYSKCR
jgi:hypothetical protein